MELIGKVKHYTPCGYGYREVERNAGKCYCGHLVELLEFTNTCSSCGRDYNMSGQLLASREQWGGETGETSGEILDIGHSTN